ncbi:pyridoxamine 5'-phosphate oxidase family protein [Hoeflea prorocentri]|uniref:nitric oxide dioxygenase n=1 Tax=Hoeflea prorocentri TaxID=1922333 RepID=A0A9X3UM89_9HYPH|nr:pyridoxamine 5'-phosphate oxidase family protein [Hoeflea prorocentri]MCY6381681.1 pyridoxamine 5'-phosphate oxidase family protein [Hoeflea prorocentri]MDA5399481.1 pyridoxamine 5'-phosphate oxidase family protein [Hoeflea prorocentri]
MSHDGTAFHRGESAVQARAGVTKEWAEHATPFVRKAMPDQHREFFENLAVLFLGLLDEQGRPWAIPAFGEPGFARSPDPRHLVLDHIPAIAGSGSIGLQTEPGSKVGLVGVELHTRRRNRMNGTIASADAAGMTIAVDQSYGNCPQWIQSRQLDWDLSKASTPNPISNGEAFTDEAKALIGRADTFFIASRSSRLSNDPRDGVDASHRGGRPGFVRINADDSLSFPDFSGNRFFNTLGNIEDDGRVGLFLPDFASGEAVFLTGRAELDWSSTRVASFRGAERIIDVRPDRIVHVENAIPSGAMLIQQWPVLAETGIWEQQQTREQSDGFRSYRLAGINRESQTITSFELEPTDGRPIAPHTAGQFLPMRYDDPETGSLISRSYTISKAPGSKTYRISVKREEYGFFSRLLHDATKPGDTLEVGAPSGDFVLDDSEDAIVMLSAGVGITPMIAMLDGQIRAVEAGARPRDIWFIHNTQNSATHAFADYLRDVSAKHSWLRVITLYSRPLDVDRTGSACQAEGRFDPDMLTQWLPFGRYQFYLCGPDGFMRGVHKGLIEFGLNPDSIHYEFFGSGTLDDAVDNSDQALPARSTVTFAASDKSVTWAPQDGTLLETAEMAGLQPSYNCRSGRCGTCSTRLVSGDVVYTQTPAVEPADGSVLICCSKPASEEPVLLDM